MGMELIHEGEGSYRQSFHWQRRETKADYGLKKKKLTSEWDVNLQLGK